MNKTIREILQDYRASVANLFDDEQEVTTELLNKLDSRAEAQINQEIERVAIERDGCPCLLVKPCDTQCSCANPVMSAGCSRCCKYGSKEQRIGMAKHLTQKSQEINKAVVEELKEISKQPTTVKVESGVRGQDPRTFTTSLFDAVPVSLIKDRIKELRQGEDK